ncbi:DUF6111 family protein [Hyphomicrobium sp.]|uniref:DUF6111 family protein n=1 Tax=Hyphomicrobium sp. TaxID=82 RepID=UPI000F9AB0C5|nr:DUF6111 family protein [Hyphomicrobium sp.]RUO99515.1 MAG: hypothetical protein EKK30_06375 [Hyphomicrobium sp.]
MIRIVLENIFFFLLPTLLYIMWIAFSEDEWAGLGTVIKEAPLVRLFFAGAALMLATLLVFSSHTYNSPNDVYVPASVVDGKLEPGHSVHNSDKPAPQDVKP